VTDGDSWHSNVYDGFRSLCGSDSD